MGSFLTGRNIKHIHYVVDSRPNGNDFLNIDNSGNTTTAGTPQMAPNFWESLFKYGKDLVIATVEKLSKMAHVHVIMVRGNHDFSSVFTMGEVLVERFRDDPNVTVVNNLGRTYHRFGKCLIGYDHGNRIKKQDAYKAISLDRPIDFGETKYRAFHLGHLHKNSKKKVFDLEGKDEFNGVEVEICPSLCATDRWHSDNLYIGNIRRSKCFVWHKEHGLITEVYFNL